MRQAVVSKIEEIAERVARSEGIEVVEVELKGGGRNQLLRISIDRPEGVTHADCKFMSQQVAPFWMSKMSCPATIRWKSASCIKRMRRLSGRRILP